MRLGPQEANAFFFWGDKIGQCLSKSLQTVTQKLKVFKSKLEMGSELCEDISISTSDITLTANGFKPAGLTPAE